MSGAFFPGFSEQWVDVGDGIVLRVRHGGHGPPVALLHGHPRTHTTWWRVAPLLAAAGHTVVCPDLRGYGRSSKPPTTLDHAPYSKRAMAADVVALMRLLGHDRFAAVGHDRGSYVAMRAALDRPDAVTHLAVLDSVPIAETLDRADARFAAAWWHWFFFAQPRKPERAICMDPDAWYGALRPGRVEAMGPDNHADFRAAISDRATVHAMLEDYRAGLGVDRAADEADRAAGRRIACPTLVLWSARDDLVELFGDPLAVWADWTTDLRGGQPIDSGHHMAEEAPGQLAEAILAFTRPADMPGRPGRDRGGRRVRGHPTQHPGDARKEPAVPKTTRSGKVRKDELPSTVERSDAKAQRTFAKAHDSAADSYGEGRRAHQTAYSALKHTHEKVGDHWEPKEGGGKGPSDARAEGGRNSDRPTKGGVDANASKRHLMELAKRLDISGRSTMTKDQLVDAIQQASDRETARSRS